MERLKPIMQTMMNRAKEIPETWTGTSLGHGLAVQLYVKAGEYFLYLSRTNTFPSETEFKTVIHCMDYQGAQAKQKQYRGRYYLYVRLPIQEALPI